MINWKRCIIYCKALSQYLHRGTAKNHKQMKQESLPQDQYFDPGPHKSEAVNQNTFPSYFYSGFVNLLFVVMTR
jgi:hypothetical protein